METITTIPKSTYIKGIEWTGERIPYPVEEVKGDTYPITWANDDTQYTSAGDPNWGESFSGLDFERIDGYPGELKIKKLNPMNEILGWGGNGPKPTGLICVDGIFYLAIQNIKKMQRPPFKQNSQHGSDAHIIYSYNRGDMWTPSFENIKEPMFPGSKFGGPAFINFGRNNEHARDEYVYAVSSDQWDNGSNLRLGRVHKDNIIDREYWEWLCAFTVTGEPIFLKKLDEAIPILSLYSHLGCPEMVYIWQLKRYILFTWHLHKDFSGNDGSDLIILESPEPWGPFSLVYHEEYWEGKEFNPYCPRLPLKWVSEDGLNAHLLFSGSWEVSGQKKLYYRVNTRSFRFIM